MGTETVAEELLATDTVGTCPVKSEIMVREPLPFADGAFRIISGERFLEHLDYPCHVIAELLCSVGD
jgi:hypothetical protein